MISCRGRFENSQRPILFDGHLGVKFMQRIRNKSADFPIEIMPSDLERSGFNGTVRACPVGVQAGFVVSLVNKSAQCFLVTVVHRSKGFGGNCSWHKGNLSRNPILWSIL